MTMKRWGNGRDYPEAFSHLQGNLLNHFRHGNADAVRAFLTHQPEWLGYWYFGDSLLHIAAQYDYPDVLAVLVEIGLDVNTPKETYPWGALDTSVMRGYLRSARRLVELGAQTTHQHRGLTFSCGTLYAVDSGNFEMVKLLVDHGAPVDVLHDDPPRGLLTAAIENGHKEIADYLRSKGALTDEEIKARTRAASKPDKRRK